MARPTKAINLSQEQNELLTRLAHSRTRLAEPAATA